MILSAYYCFICIYVFTCINIDSYVWKITDLTEENVLGRMFKRWAGCGREMFTDADTFGVTCKYDTHTHMQFT